MEDIDAVFGGDVLFDLVIIRVEEGDAATVVAVGTDRRSAILFDPIVMRVDEGNAKVGIRVGFVRANPVLVGVEQGNPSVRHDVAEVGGKGPRVIVLDVIIVGVGELDAKRATLDKDPAHAIVVGTFAASLRKAATSIESEFCK